MVSSFRMGESRRWFARLDHMTPFGGINDHMTRAEFLPNRLNATSALRTASAVQPEKCRILTLLPSGVHAEQFFEHLQNSESQKPGNRSRLHLPGGM